MWQRIYLVGAVQSQAHCTCPGAQWCLSRFTQGLWKGPRQSLAVSLNHCSSHPFFQVSGRWKAKHKTEDDSHGTRQCNRNDHTAWLTCSFFQVYSQRMMVRVFEDLGMSSTYFLLYSIFNCWENQHWYRKRQGKWGDGPTTVTTINPKQQSCRLSLVKWVSFSFGTPDTTTPHGKLFSPALHMHLFILVSHS